jgi:hypothetical protein
MDEKFVVGFSIEGAGQGQLKQIQAGFEAIAAAAAKGGAGGASAEMEKTSTAAEQLKNIVEGINLGNLHTGLSSAEQSLGRLSAMAGDLKDGLVGAFKDFTKEAATFEDIESGLQFAFKSKWQDVYKEVKKDALNLTFTLQETAQLTNSMGRMGVNPFGGENAEDQLFMAKTGKKIRALEVLQDMADATGRDVNHMSLGIKNAVGGQWMVFKDAIDQTPAVLDRIKKAVNGAKTAQEKYNIILKESALLFGGAGQLKDLNFNKVYAQIPDMVQQLKGGAAKDGLRDVTIALKEFVGVTSQIPQSATVIKGLSDGFKVFTDIAVVGVKAGTKISEFLANLVEAFPWLPKVAAYLGVLAVAFGVLAVAVVGAAMTALLAVVGVMMVGLPMAIFGAVLTVGALTAAFAGLGAAIMIGYSLWSMFSTGVSDSIGSWENVQIVVSAVYETLKNWNNYAAGVSDETYDKLESKGLLPIFYQIIGVIRDAKIMFDQFWHGFTHGLDQVTQPLKDSLLRAMEKLWALLTAVFNIFEGGGEAINEIAGGAERFGYAMAWALEGAVSRAIRFVDKIGEIAESGEATAETIAGITDAIFTTIIATSKLLAIVVQVGAAFASVGLIVNNVYSMIHFMVSSLDTALKLLGILTGRQVHADDERVSNGRFWGDMSFGDRVRYEMGEHRKAVDDDRARSLSLRGIADSGDTAAKDLWNTEGLEAQKKAWHDTIVGAGRTIEHAYKTSQGRYAPPEVVDNSWIGGGFKDDMWGDTAKAGPRVEKHNYGPVIPTPLEAPAGTSAATGGEYQEDPELVKRRAMEAAAAAAEARLNNPDVSGGPQVSQAPTIVHLDIDGETVATKILEIKPSARAMMPGRF